MYLLTPGQWYLIFTCSKCKSLQVLFPDLTGGTSKINAIYTTACCQCRHKASYDGQAIRRYRHPHNAPALKLAP